MSTKAVGPGWPGTYVSTGERPVQYKFLKYSVIKYIIFYYYC